MQFQVPQFIETEDKVVGPFTIVQFVYIGAAGIVSFLLYFTVELWLWAIGTILALAVAFGFAFIKIEGRPLMHVIAAALSFYWKPQTYVWQSEYRGAAGKAGLAGEGGISLEEIFSGAALRSAWKNLQTGARAPSKKVFGGIEKYQIFQKLTGERRAARRIDYR